MFHTFKPFNWLSPWLGHAPGIAFGQWSLAPSRSNQTADPPVARGSPLKGWGDSTLDLGSFPYSGSYGFPSVHLPDSVNLDGNMQNYASLAVDIPLTTLHQILIHVWRNNNLAA